jgi:hypothetical protein
MYRSYYRTHHGRVDYDFGFQRLNAGWRVYVLGQPPYCGRDTCYIATHRLRDERGRYYICWTRPLRTREEAQAVAALWAERTQHYIATGARF